MHKAKTYKAFFSRDAPIALRENIMYRGSKGGDFKAVALGVK
jgi:hypothetical protein